MPELTPLPRDDGERLEGVTPRHQVAWVWLARCAEKCADARLERAAVLQDRLPPKRLEWLVASRQPGLLAEGVHHHYELATLPKEPRERLELPPCGELVHVWKEALPRSHP
ncbi:hypothetical protein [Mumia zhuanghuii]|uniref:Uncharacterized protein n=1 Tax=Mumia zhuanghuii TaxID=2585211 RepID=A0A5C4LXZ4_9ACTN|nr:hypothetical protein [Mumia zhuanghuii]TNC22845.1 hypothetical protein FHE65_35650 [Mumia zhuanghuii]